VRSTQQFSITLPNDLASRVRLKVESGAYATESEVIRDGLRALEARDKLFEQWLLRDVVASYDATKAKPNRGISPKSVRTMLAKADRRVRRNKSAT